MRARRALIALAVLEIIAIVLGGRATSKMPDLEVYWTAARRFAAAEPLYRSGDEHYQFKYLPASALVLSPLGALSLPSAKAAWLVVSVALLVLFVWISLNLPLARARPEWLPLALVVVSMGKFFSHELVLGQVNLLFGVAIVAALLAMRRSAEQTAGVLIAFAIAIKPYAVLFLPWLIARRQWRAVLAVSAGLVCIAAAPAIFYGVAGDIELHRAWLRTVTASTAPNLTNADNVSVAALYAKWLGAGGLAASLAASTAALLLAAAAAVFLLRRGIAFAEGLEGALLLTLVPLLSPQGWDYVLLLATPAAVYLATYRESARRLADGAIAAMVVAGVAIYDVIGRAAYGVFMNASVVTLCYLLVIATLCATRMRRIA